MKNASLSYATAGRGSVVVLLHGFCASSLIWERFQQVLAEQFCVITIDLPGFGKNPPIEGDISIEEMADAVREQLMQLEVEDCTLIGHSMGGYVALAYANRYPNHLNGLGLFHSTSYADSEEKKRDRDQTIKSLEQNGVESFIECFVPPLFFHKNRASQQSIIRLLHDIGNRTAVSSIIASTKAMRDRRNYSAVLVNLPHPVMFIAGREDGAIPFDDHKQQFTLPGDTTIHILSETGHMGMFERGEETVRMVRGFVEMCALRSGRKV